MIRIVGYLRPNADNNNVQAQLDQLNAAGVSKIYREKPSSTRCDTPQLDLLLAEVRAGDTVVITSLDRIAHNTKHLLQIMESLNASGVTLRAIDNGIDTSTSPGTVLRMLLEVIVDFERQGAKERQSAGIAKAKREGRYKGRKPTARAKSDEVLELNDQGLTRQKIADHLGIGVASVYRILKNQTKPRKVSKNNQKEAPDQLKRAERKPIREPDTVQLSLF